MAFYKAVKLEVMILVEAEMEDSEIVRWTQDALRDYCDFENTMCKIVEKHSNILLDPDKEALA